MHTNISAGIIVSYNSLALQRVHRMSRGRYTCTASNTEGEGQSNAVLLRVQYAPVCRTSQKILYGAARHETVRIVCEVDADPPQVNFRWAFDKSKDKVVAENQVTSSDGTVSIVNYVPRSELDYGTLFCWASNHIGSQIEPCIFSVIPAGPPAPLYNCTIVNRTEDSIRIDCSSGHYDAGGLVQQFVMEVRDPEVHKLIANISNTWPSFDAKGLPPGEYVMLIYALNAKGKSDAVVLTAATLALPESMNRMAKGAYICICALAIG